MVVKTDASFIGNLDVAGQLGVSDIKLTGDVSFQENIDVNKRLMVTLDSSLNGNVTVGINLEVENRLDISGDVSMNNNVSIVNNLIVDGSVRGGYDSDIASYFGRAAIGSTPSSNDQASFAHIDCNNDEKSFALQQMASGATVLNAKSGQTLDLRINSSTKVRLASDGKLGIGTTSPTSLLTVRGDVSLNGYVDISDNLTVSGSITASTYKTTVIPSQTNEIGYNNTTTIAAGTSIPDQSSSIATLHTVVLQPGVYRVDGFFTVDAQAGNFGTTTYITEGSTNLARNYTIVTTGGFTTSYISKIIEVSAGTTRTILFRGSQNGVGGYTVVTVDAGEFNVLRVA